MKKGAPCWVSAFFVSSPHPEVVTPSECAAKLGLYLGRAGQPTCPGDRFNITVGHIVAADTAWFVLALPPNCKHSSGHRRYPYRHRRRDRVDDENAGCRRSNVVRPVKGLSRQIIKAIAVQPHPGLPVTQGITGRPGDGLLAIAAAGEGQANSCLGFRFGPARSKSCLVGPG